MRVAFILSEIGSGLRRNLSMVISVILVTFVSLSFIGGAALLQMQINQMKDYWYDKVQVSIFLCADNSGAQTCAAGAITDEQRADIESMMDSPAVAPYVDSYQHETQAEALTHFQDQFENSPIVDTVTADQLPESFRVRLVDPEKYEVINELFSSMEGVDVVVDQRELLEQIFSIMNVASLVSLGIAGVMIVCAVLLVATTIRLSAFSRRRETGIMRLVGASKLVIQLPFVLEGVIAAVIGALLASGALWAVARYFIEGHLAQQYPGTAFIASSQVWVIAPGLVILGAVLAGISSMLTLRRYLKV
ncbi:cell division protein FtsX [Kocuria polaris]|nr:cell division protein FtsX [Kocuria polaris]